MHVSEAYGWCELGFLLMQGGWMGWWSSLKRQGSTTCCTLCYAVTTGGTPCRPLPGTLDSLFTACGCEFEQICQCSCAMQRLLDAVCIYLLIVAVLALNESKLELQAKDKHGLVLK